MAYAAVDPDGTEIIFDSMPVRKDDSQGKRWSRQHTGHSSIIPDEHFVVVPKGTFKRIFGYRLSWAYDPVPLPENEE